MKKLCILLWVCLNISTFASSVCGKISEIRTPMDIQNDVVQSVLVITRTDMFTVKDEIVVVAAERALKKKLGTRLFEEYLYQHDRLAHLSEEGFTICFNEEPVISRTFPYPIVDRVRNFTIHHKTFVLYDSRKDEI